MAGLVIDLTGDSDNEQDGTPRKAANSALQRFQPRKEKVHSVTRANGIENDITPEPEAHQMVDIEPPGNGHATTGRSEVLQRASVHFPRLHVVGTMEQEKEYPNNHQGMRSAKTGTSQHRNSDLPGLKRALGQEDDATTMPMRRNETVLNNMRKSAVLERPTKIRRLGATAAAPPGFVTFVGAGTRAPSRLTGGALVDVTWSNVHPGGVTGAQLTQHGDRPNPRHFSSEDQTSRRSTHNPPSLCNSADRTSQPRDHPIDGLGPSGTKQKKKTPRSFTEAEDALIIRLKEVEKLSWAEIAPHFPNRTWTTLQVHYSSKLKRRNDAPRSKTSLVRPELIQTSHSKEDPTAILADGLSSSDSRLSVAKRGLGLPNSDGIVSRQDARSRKSLRGDEPAVTPHSISALEALPSVKNQNDILSSSLERILRHREMGLSSARAGHRDTRAPCDEMRNHVLDTIGPCRYFKGTSADVNCVAWSSDGRHFAAGSIAITDERSMQYNRPYNLLYGDTEDKNILYELPEHHVPRPTVDASSSFLDFSQSMQQTQDPRLFTTVGNVAFSPAGDKLFTVGEDRVTRVYNVLSDPSAASAPTCRHAFDHSARVDLLSVSSIGVLATAQHSAQDSIILYDQNALSHEYRRAATYGPQQPSPSSLPVFPSTLKFGIAPQYQHFLLAGFASDSYDDDLMKSGQSQLWDIRAGQLIDLATTHNVFDVAWNPVPSATSTVFAVASAPTTRTRGVRSVIQCFAPDQTRAKRVLEWDCPALDINDVVYCQHDDSLIAAGATDGKVYVWDQRYASKSQGPLHVFRHGETLNVLDHDRLAEEADTGVRFLAWGATRSRLYTGSSDGKIKVWDSLRANENALVRDVVTFGSAVMSGAFSPDYRSLLIGEDQGQINLLSIDCERKPARSANPFALKAAPVPAEAKNDTGISLAREFLDSMQIELRPMGDLPIRQAVQGPRYCGPYFRPTEEQSQETERRYQDALEAQHDAHSKAAVTESQDASTTISLRDVDNRVRDAQVAIERLESRRRDADTLEQQASETQFRFQQMQYTRCELQKQTQYGTRPCQLDCNYLPVDNDGEVPDSGSSFLRIPSNLRKLRLEYDEISLFETDARDQRSIATTCGLCSAQIDRTNGGKPQLCRKCSLKSNGLTAVCSRCSLPARLSEPTQSEVLCQRCSFSCLRCSKPARVSPRTTCITCTACGLVWEAGVLGYTLLDRPVAGKAVESRRAVTATRHDEDDFGAANIEHYHSRWQERGMEGWSAEMKRAYQQH